jgi:hypothetical protein
MIGDGAMTLLGFAWHARRPPEAGSPGPGAHPFDGIESTYRPLCWPIGPGESGVRDGGPGLALLIITPALAFLTSGPPEVGRGWEVEPAELDGFRTEDGRGRLVGLGRHRTRWGTVAACEFEGAPTVGGLATLPRARMAVLPANPPPESSRPEQARGSDGT